MVIPSPTLPYPHAARTLRSFLPVATPVAPRVFPACNQKSANSSAVSRSLGSCSRCAFSQSVMALSSAKNPFAGQKTVPPWPYLLRRYAGQFEPLRCWHTLPGSYHRRSGIPPKPQARWFFRSGDGREERNSVFFCSDSISKPKKFRFAYFTRVFSGVSP